MSDKLTVSWWKNGVSQVGTSPTKIVSTARLPELPKRGILIKAPGDLDSAPNTQPVWLGNSKVTAGTDDSNDGFPLAPGESVSFPLDLAHDMYVVSLSGEQRVYWVIV